MRNHLSDTTSPRISTLSAKKKPRLILGADEAGWNPCPTHVVNLLKTLVTPAKSGVLLDNCAGNGIAATRLARAWNLGSYLVEPNLERFAMCQRRRNAVSVCARAESIRSTCAPSVWFFNPPFDPDDPTGDLEYSLLEVSVAYAIGPDTLVILVLPERSIRNRRMTCLLSKILNDVKIRRFPDPWYRTYRQIVVFGYGSSVLRDSHMREPGPTNPTFLALPRIKFLSLKAREFSLRIRVTVDRFSVIGAMQPVKPPPPDL